MSEPKTRRSLGGCLALVAGLAAIAVAAGTGSATAGSPPSAMDVDEAGAHKIFTVTDLAPGATFSGWWNHTVQGLANSVDAWPTTNFINEACKIEVVRWWKEKTILFGDSELEVHWTIKNVGSSTCGADVYLTWINPSGS